MVNFGMLLAAIKVFSAGEVNAAGNVIVLGKVGGCEYKILTAVIMRYCEQGNQRASRVVNWLVS